MTSRVPAVLAAALLLAACGGGEPTGPSAAPLAITLPVDTIRPGGVLVVDVSGTRFPTDSVAGTVGGTSVTFVRVSDSTIAMIAPNLPAGRHNVSITLPGGALQTTVDVKPALTFADPKGALFQALDAQLAAFPLNAPPGYDPAAWSARRAALDSLVQEAKADISALDGAGQLELARVMIPLLPSSGGALGASFLNWDNVDCRNAVRRAAKSALASVMMSAALYVFIAAPPANPLLKAGGIGLSGMALVGALLQLHDDMQVYAAECTVQEAIDMSELYSGLSLRMSGPSRQASTGGVKRFFKGYGVKYFPVGGFRPLSREEVAQDKELGELSGRVDRLHAWVAKTRSLLPARIAARLPALPSRIALPKSTTLTTELTPPADVRLENVKPASIQLALTTSGSQIVLTPGASTTVDVPFTYDVVLKADSKVRKTMHGVLRPFMSAQHILPSTTITGDRSIVRQGGVDYGVLTCGGAWTLKVTGGDKARAESFDWQVTGTSTVGESEPVLDSQGNKLVFQEGNHPMSGSWYWMSNDANGPTYTPFTIVVRFRYTDLVTGELKEAITPTVRCI